MGHPVLIEELKKEKAFIVQEDILFLRENLLTAVSLLV